MNSAYKMAPGGMSGTIRNTASRACWKDTTRRNGRKGKVHVSIHSVSRVKFLFTSLVLHTQSLSILVNQGMFTRSAVYSCIMSCIIFVVCVCVCVCVCVFSFPRCTLLRGTVYSPHFKIELGLCL
jgi:hypothetical protein